MNKTNTKASAFLHTSAHTLIVLLSALAMLGLLLALLLLPSQQPDVDASLGGLQLLQPRLGAVAVLGDTVLVELAFRCPPQHGHLDAGCTQYACFDLDRAYDVSGNALSDLRCASHVSLPGNGGHGSVRFALQDLAVGTRVLRVGLVRKRALGARAAQVGWLRAILPVGLAAVRA